jgi:membrane protein YqaA with SNARE-associated domain
MKQKMLRWVKVLQGFIDRIWYAPLIALLALLDNIILVIPNDGILVSSTMLQPKRWLYYAIAITVGSTLGAMVLAMLVENFGLPTVLQFAPGFETSATWIQTDKFFTEWGLWVVFGVAVAPILQQPAVVLAAAAGIPLFEIVAIVFIGRLIKYLIMSYIASHAPAMIYKIWGIQGDLHEVGLDP